MREYPGGIPREIYKLPKSEIERISTDIERGLEVDGKGTFTVFYPPCEREWVNEEKLVTQLKVFIAYCRREVSFYERTRDKRTAKATHVSHRCCVERIEWVPEGLLIVPHGSPYEGNFDILIVPEDERVTDYMPYEQCNRCKLDHCCWSNGSFIWEDGNTPNNCKEFMPEEEE